jgi:hypothetical protein
VKVEIVEETESQEPAQAFPPEEDYSDLRANPQAIEGIAAAKRYLPLRNFLTAVNGADSIFATAGAAVKADSPAAVSAGSAYEFASETGLVFAEQAMNGERKQYTDLCAGLKELLERDSADTARASLRISSCEFSAEKRRGFCLSIRLVAEGSSAQQAELRWGLGLARLQQALLFRSRNLKHQIAD